MELTAELTGDQKRADRSPELRKPELRADKPLLRAEQGSQAPRVKIALGDLTSEQLADRRSEQR